MDEVAWWVPILPVTLLLVGAQVARRHRGRRGHWYAGLVVMALALAGQAWIEDRTWLRVGFVVLALVVVPLGHVRRPVALRERARPRR